MNHDGPDQPTERDGRADPRLRPARRPPREEQDPLEDRPARSRARHGRLRPVESLVSPDEVATWFG
jgi:hypothetical protein